jgi:hypothetical protein
MELEPQRREGAKIVEPSPLTDRKLSGHALGFLINFNVARIRDAMRRFVNP